jgi:ABC-type antimicrobial peptide transport system permease subunit
MKKVLVSLGLFALSPALALAAGEVTQTFNNLNNTATGLKGFIGELTNTVNAAVPLGLALCVVIFIYAVIRLMSAKDGVTKEKMRPLLIWSVVAIAVIISIFGLAKFLAGFFGVGGGQLNATDIPKVNAI